MAEEPYGRQTTGLFSLTDDMLHTAYLAALQPDFDTMRMKGRIGENILYDAPRKPSGPLVLL